MKIIAVPIKAADLQPGDLFSSVGPEFWDTAHLGEINKRGERAIGVKTYIRTEAQAPELVDSDQMVYRLHIIPTHIEQILEPEAIASLVAEDTADPMEDNREQTDLEPE